MKENNVKMNDKVTINIDELVDSVNKFDKTFAIRLKHPDPSKAPDKFFLIHLEECREILLKIIAGLNGLDVAEFISHDEDGFPIPNEEYFFENSLIDWSEQEYEVNSTVFKCRFLTLHLKYLYDRLKKITFVKYDKCYVHVGKFESAYLILDNIMSYEIKLVKALLLGYDCKNLLFKALTDLSFRSRKPDQLTINRRMVKNRDKMISSLQCEGTTLEIKGGFGGGILSRLLVSNRNNELISANNEARESFLMDSVFKISYSFACYSVKYKDVPTIPENFVLACDISKYLTQLGQMIRKKNASGKVNPMFIAFTKSNPRITTKYYRAVNDYDLTLGICAVEFTNFMCKTDGVSNFIDKMIR